MAHNSYKAIVLDCMDPRLVGKVAKWLAKEKGILEKEYYDPALAGGCKPLVSPKREGDREFVLEHLEIACGHGVSEAIIINHTDCAAYGGSSNFISFQEERAFQIKEMEKARDIILARYPSLKISLVLAVINPSTNEVERFEEII